MRRERSSSSPRGTMDFRALPPQRRQGIGRSHAGPDTRFGKRRSDRFAIFYQSLQLLGETDRSFHLGFAFRLRQPKDWRHRRCRWRASSKRCAHSCWRVRRRRRSGVAAAASCLATGFLDPACRVGRDKLRTDESDVVPKVGRRLRPKVRAVRCLQADKARRQVCEER
jgi:hypothetical protein